MTFMNVSVEDQQVRLYAGGRAGVATCLTRGVVKVGDQQLDQVARYTEVFEKRAGSWQAVAGHHSSLKETK
jgi:hypothetical protein